MNRGTAFLKHAYFFRDLDGSIIDAVAERCGYGTYRAGQFVFREGEQGDSLFIVLSGEVQVWKHHAREDANLLARYQTGRIFGEMALVDELPRSATAVTGADSELLYLRREDFLGLVQQYPGLSMSVMRSLSAIVRESNDSFVSDLYHRNMELEEAYARLEEAQKGLLMNERMSNLGKMSNMILHDIRNPVSVLKGYAEMLVQLADQPDRVREFAQRVAVEADRLGQLSGELLDYSRGEIRLDLSVVPPERIIRTVRTYVDDRMRTDGVDFQTEAASDGGIVVDFQRLVRALVNLVDNARNACGHGGTVTLSVIEESGVTLFTVQDTGEGMSPEVSERIFEPFFSQSRRGGTGLGLVIVRSVVEAHGGTLKVESIPGTGTTFTIRLPSLI